MNLETLAIQYLNQRMNNQVIPHGFPTELDRQNRLADPHEICSWREAFNGRPDGYMKLLIEGYIWLIAVEVEDTHPMSREKLLAYAELWDCLDYTATHRLGLITTDRYGRPQWLNLELVRWAVLTEGSRLRACTDAVPNVDAENLEAVVEACKRHRHRTRPRKYYERKRQKPRMLEYVKTAYGIGEPAEA